MAEGDCTVPATVALAPQEPVEMLITEAATAVHFHSLKPLYAVSGLMLRDAEREMLGMSDSA